MGDDSYLRLCRDSRDSPEMDLLVATPTGKHTSIGTEHYTGRFSCMADKRVNGFAALHLPEPDRLIITPTGECLPIGTPDDTPNMVQVAFQDANSLACTDIP